MEGKGWRMKGGGWKLSHKHTPVLFYSIELLVFQNAPDLLCPCVYVWCVCGVCGVCGVSKICLTAAL